MYRLPTLAEWTTLNRADGLMLSRDGGLLELVNAPVWSRSRGAYARQIGVEPFDLAGRNSLGVLSTGVSRTTQGWLVDHTADEHISTQIVGFQSHSWVMDVTVNSATSDDRLWGRFDMSPWRGITWAFHGSPVRLAMAYGSAPDNVHGFYYATNAQATGRQVIDGTWNQSTGGLRFFHNGALNGTATTSTNAIQWSSFTGVGIGGLPTWTFATASLDGTIHSFQIWDRVLSDAEMAVLGRANEHAAYLCRPMRRVYLVSAVPSAAAFPFHRYYDGSLVG